MIQKGFNELVFEFSKLVSSLENALYIFLFGSVARGKADARSDIDFCVITDGGNNKQISSIALDLEKKYDKNIQLVVSKNFTKLDKYFLSQILKEGILLYGRNPIVEIKGINYKGYALFSFSLKGLDQSSKMKVKRILYGYSTKKDKYESSSSGLVSDFNGLFAGRGAILIPSEKASVIEEVFGSWKVTFKRHDMFMKI
jgi:predicted nucleotidyltransferase